MSASSRRFLPEFPEENPEVTPLHKEEAPFPSKKALFDVSSHS